MRTLLVILALSLIAFILFSDGAKDSRRFQSAEKSASPDPDKRDGRSSRWTLPTREEIKLAPISELAGQLNAAGQQAREDLAIVDQLLAYYRKVFGQNPVGLNSEIVLQLAGRNEKSLAVIPPDHQAIDASGQLLDRWGSPLFFHQVSGDRMEIVSAGPDKELWTGDDVKHVP